MKMKQEEKSQHDLARERAIRNVHYVNNVLPYDYLESRTDLDLIRLVHPSERELIAKELGYKLDLGRWVKIKINEN